MNIEEAAELILSGEGKHTCHYCGGRGRDLTDTGWHWTCTECEGDGYYVSDRYAEARRMLGLSELDGQVYQGEPDPQNPLIRSRDRMYAYDP